MKNTLSFTAVTSKLDMPNEEVIEKYRGLLLLILRVLEIKIIGILRL